jgi:hypothetical protein
MATGAFQQTRAQQTSWRRLRVRQIEEIQLFILVLESQLPSHTLEEHHSFCWPFIPLIFRVLVG